jgi:hypothetical protein
VGGLRRRERVISFESPKSFFSTVTSLRKTYSVTKLSHSESFFDFGFGLKTRSHPFNTNTNSGILGVVWCFIVGGFEQLLS